MCSNAWLKERNENDLFEQAEIAMLDKSELRDYRESQKDYWDLYAVTETAEKKGFRQGLMQGKEEGLAEGMEKGARIKAIQTAAQLKSLGIPVSIISLSTGLTEDEIEVVVGDSRQVFLVFSTEYCITQYSYGGHDYSWNGCIVVVVSH